MRDSGIAANVLTYSSLISAMAKGRQWQKAVLLFEGMQKVRTPPCG